MIKLYVYLPDIKYLLAYAQNPSDMFRQLSEGADDNAQISSFSTYSATFDSLSWLQRRWK